MAKNQGIVGENGKIVSVVTDGTTERLAVDAKITLSTLPSTTNMGELVANGKVYSLARSINMATAGVKNPVILIKNPSGSGKDLYIHSVRVGLDVQNNYVNIITYHNPTITANGTAYTPVNRSLGGGFGASAMQVFTVPTISANGTEVSNVEVAENGNSIEEAVNFTILLKPNNNLLITGDPKSNNRIGVFTIVWAEI